MKSILAANVIVFSCLLFISYMVYEYNEYGSGFLIHFFDPDRPIDFIFHILIFITPIGAFITGYLINERKKILFDADQSKQKLTNMLSEWKTTLDSMPYGVMLIDKEYNIIRANKYISELAGVPLKELKSKKCYEVIHRNEGAIDGYPIHESWKSGETKSFEYYDREHKKHFLATISPITDESGSIVAFSHPLIDITNIKEKEQKLTQSKDAFLNMLKDLNTSHKELKLLYDDLITAFSIAIDAKSPWTLGHSERVTEFSVLIANEMGLTDKDIRSMKTAGLLHDIGKIGTFDMILDKPDQLSGFESTIVRQHPIKGEDILRPINGLRDILPIIRAHHEKFDGSGYPDGIKGDAIPILARILCVADSYDAMISNRPYRFSLGKDYAMTELRRCAGKHFDNNVVDVFLNILSNESETAIHHKSNQLPVH